MTRFITSSLILLFFCSVSFSQTLYLKFDDNCADRLEYSSGAGTGSYVSYSFTLPNKKMVVMDVGIESGKGVRDLQSKVLYCTDLVFDKALVQKINDGSTKLVIVTETSTQYLLNPVDKAIFIEQVNNTIEFTSSDADFLFYLDNLVSDVNLAKPASKQEVYLEGTLKTQCSTGYIFRKKDNYRSADYKEFTLIPDIGIVEKRSVSGSGFFSSDKSNSLALDRLDNTTYRDYLSSICDKQQAAYYDGYVTSKPSSYGDLVPKVGEERPKSYAGSDPCAPSTVNGIHVVQKGETMYGIARRYGISLAQLRAWNTLPGTDLISICQQLNVSPGAGAISTGSTGTATSTASTGATSVITEKGTGNSAAGSAGYWISAPEVHVVKPGESIGMLANMYGYTEERFRKMNSLSATERIYVGQKLHTNDCVCPTLESTTKDKPLPYEAETAVLSEKARADVYFRPIQVHLVQKEDTIFSIAKQYNTTTDRIMELNGMKKGDSIQVNQRLYVQ